MSENLPLGFHLESESVTPLPRALTRIKHRLGCHRCGAETGLWNQMQRLLGGYSGHFCAECINEFEVLMREDPDALDLRAAHYRIELRRVAAASVSDGNDLDIRSKVIADLWLEADVIERRLYAKTEAWATDLVERDEPPKKLQPEVEADLLELTQRRIKRFKTQLVFLEREEKELTELKERNADPSAGAAADKAHGQESSSQASAPSSEPS